MFLVTLTSHLNLIKYLKKNKEKRRRARLRNDRSNLCITLSHEAYVKYTDGKLTTLVVCLSRKRNGQRLTKSMENLHLKYLLIYIVNLFFAIFSCFNSIFL